MSRGLSARNGFIFLGVIIILTTLVGAPALLGNQERRISIQATIDTLQSSSSRHRELVIALKHGVVYSYDEANYWRQRTRELETQLKRQISEDTELKTLYERYKESTQNHGEHWELFKIHNSVVRNSLSYLQTNFPQFIKLFDQLDLPETAGERFSILNIELYQLALGENLDSKAQALEILSSLSAEIKSSQNSQSTTKRFDLMERHARVILDRAPILTAVTSALTDGAGHEHLNQLAQVNHTLDGYEEQKETLYRSALLLSVIILFIGLVVTGTRYFESQRLITEQASFLKNLTDTIQLGVVATSPNGQVMFSNPYLERLFGEIKGTSLDHSLQLENDKQGDLSPSQVLSKLSSNDSISEICSFRKSDGTLVPTEISATSLKTNTGKGVVAVFQDISKRLLEERDLRLAATVFESSQHGIIITDSSGSIVRVNPAYCEMTGYSAEELIGKNPRILQSGLQDSSFYSSMWNELLKNNRWQGELCNQRKDGEHFVQWANIDAVETDQNERLYVGIASDISELVNARERLSSLAYFDPLTELPNRVLFQDRVSQALAQYKRNKSHFTLILADLDNFKNVNDTLGHASGDQLLIQVASRLKQSVREIDTVARLGGDEFALLLMDIHKPEEAATVATHILEKLSKPFKVHGLEIIASASLGITFWPTDGNSLDELLKHADVAMYRAKSQGRNNFQFFTTDMAEAVADTLQIENHLRHSLEKNELSLHYQPQFNNSGRVTSAEALMRWNSSELGFVPPDKFIPIAERSGLIVLLSEFALRQACKQCKKWRKTLHPEFRIAVNLSAAQFRHEGLAEKVVSILDETGLPPDALELEITESAVMDDVARGQMVIDGLKTLGCKISVDDFGTGHSSLAYLTRFQLDVLKIDKSFIDGLGEDPEDTLVTSAIVNLARSLQLDVVAEGVETIDQLNALKDITRNHSYLAQGYLFSRPLPADEFVLQYPDFSFSGW